VEIPETVETIICLGSGAPRIAAYLGVMDMLVGAEDHDIKGVTVLRDYNVVYQQLLSKLPAVGAGGGSGANNGYAEQIIEVQPDVILAGFSQEAAEELQNQTGIPVVCVRYLSINFVDESFYSAMRVFAEVVGAQKRCEEVLKFIDDCKKDLNDRTKDIPDSEKPSVYVGGVSFKGHHGFEGTEAFYGPFALINARNLADTTGQTGAFNIDLEQVLAWDPDIIFLDFNGMSLINEDYAKNPDFYNSLTAVQEGRVYSQISFRSSASNLETALADAYYAACVMYPAQFGDVDPVAKAGEIFEMLLGVNPYEDLKEAGYAFCPIKLGA
jgi:iron complex transport system substrate-binding protein